MRRLGLAAVALAAAAADPVAAQQTAAAAPVFDFALPPPADTGKALLPRSRRDDAPRPDRLQLRGNLDRNGAVELRARAFSW